MSLAQPPANIVTLDKIHHSSIGKRVEPPIGSSLSPSLDMEQDTPREFEESAPSKADVERIETPIDGEVDQALRTPIPDDSDSDLDSLLSSDDEVLMEVETPIEPPTMAHDSMVTVRLSEPPLLTIDTDLANVASPKIDTEIEVQEVLAGKDGDNNNHNNNDDADDNTDDADSIAAATTIRDSSTTISNISVLVPDEQQDSTTTSSQNEEDNNDPGIDNDNDHDTSVDSSDSDTESERVNWDKLEQTEDEQTKDEDTDNVSASICSSHATSSHYIALSFLTKCRAFRAT